MCTGQKYGDASGDVRQIGRRSVMRGRETNAKLSHGVVKWIMLAMGCLVSAVVSRYLRIEPQSLVLVISLCVFIPNSLWFAEHLDHLWREPKICILALLFAGVFALAVVLGFHLVLYSDVLDQYGHAHYVTSYSKIDVFAFVVMTFGGFVLAVRLFLRAAYLKKDSVDRVALCLDEVRARGVALAAVAIFVMWLPYLLSYWPGFIFGDSLSTLRQAIGASAWGNHHPVAYTAIVALCIKIANFLGFGNSVGCALYTSGQMVLMAASLSYCANWIKVRFGLSAPWVVGLSAIFGLTPYFATLSISMWKDPLFSSSVVVVSLLLFDYALKKGMVGKAWTLAYGLSLVLVLFMRSNGLAIAALTALALFVFALVARKRGAKIGGTICVALLTIALSICQMVVTGPVYASLGIQPAEPIESRGLLMNQMARVVALDGEASEEELAYLNELTPIDSYKTSYDPIIVDGIKWNGTFDNSALDERFIPTWISLGLKNPQLYLESWELQTCGYWAINVPAVNMMDRNISAGVDRNTDSSRVDQLEKVGVHARNILGSSQWREVFPSDDWSVPVSWINWLVLLLLVCLALSGQGELLIGFVPTTGLALSLLVASPLWYWPRYGAAEQMLLPLYIAFFYALVFRRNNYSPAADRGADLVKMGVGEVSL